MADTNTRNIAIVAGVGAAVVVIGAVAYFALKGDSAKKGGFQKVVVKKDQDDNDDGWETDS